MLEKAIIDLVAQCASGVDPLILKSLIVQESANHPYAIHDGYTHKAHFPDTKKQAVALAKQLRAKGHRLDLGLTQINTQNFKWLNLSIESAFNPCTSIKASSTVLKDAMKRTPDIRKQLSIYNSGKKNSVMGLRYADAILKRAGKTPRVKRTRKQVSHKKSTLKNNDNKATARFVIHDGFSQYKAQSMQVALDGFAH